MKDRFSRGFIAGVVAAVPAFLWNKTAVYLLKISNMPWSEFAALFILGRKHGTSFEAIFSDFATLFFAGLMGILSAYAIQKISSGNILFKGWVFGVTIWFIVFALAHLYRMPELASIDLGTVLSNLVGASIWGLAVGYSLKWLDVRAQSLEKGR